MTFTTHGARLLILALTAAFTASAAESVLPAYGERLPALRQHLPDVIRAAEAAAARVVATPATHLILPRHDPGFGSEMLGRAGGLSRPWVQAAPRVPFADGDIILLSVRDWAKEADVVKPLLAKYKEHGCMVMLFAPAAGRPADAPADFLIDNGSPAGGDERVAILANVTNGWLWCCEYAAALTRQGKVPGVLRSVALDDGRANNKPLQNPEGRQWLGQAETPVPAGRLAGLYLDRVDKLLVDLRSQARQDQLNTAAELVATRLKERHPVYLTGLGHLVSPEIARGGFRTSWTPFRYAAFDKQLKPKLEPDDLMVWIGYIGNVGLNRQQHPLYDDLLQLKTRLILSQAPVSDKENTLPDVLAHVDPVAITPDPSPTPVIARIDQAWAMPDADVRINWSPGWMAPVSGLNAVLVLHLLDEAVAARLAGK